MKHGLIVLLVLGAVQWAGAQDNGHGLLLPGMRQPLRSGMTLTEIGASVPDTEKTSYEVLANGTTFCYADVGYPLLLQLHDGKLLDINVNNVKATSKFGKWFNEQVRSFPAGSVRSNSSDAKQPTMVWTSPKGTWWSRHTEKGRMNYSILFPTDLVTLADGMVIRYDSLDIFEASRLVAFDTPPRSVNQPRPAYPEPAQKSTNVGRVLVQLHVDTHGDVQRWKIAEIHPVGPGFAREVAKVIPQWKFEPARKNGEPVATWVALPFSFKFDKAEAHTKFWPK